MTSRERWLAAARRQEHDRVPRSIWFLPEVSQNLAAHVGIPVEELNVYLKEDVRNVWPNATRHGADFSRYFKRPGVDSSCEWGRGRIWDDEHHYAEYLYPLEDAETEAEIENYPWPDLMAAYRYEGLTERVAKFHAQGFPVIGGLAETVFEVALELRSMDRLFEDILTESPLATLLLDKITERREVMAREYAKAGCDAIDVSMQTGLMMSRAMFNRWFRPRLERCIRAAREIEPDILVQYHSDGKINDLIPDLIEAGVDILNPVQPECVDHRWVAETYGNRISFAGGLGVQSVLPFGTPAEVREHTRATIEALNRNHGLIVGPSHVIETDIPMANILAMAAAIDEFGTM